MKASQRIWILVLLLAPIYAGLITAGVSWSLYLGLPEGVVMLGPGDLAWRHVYAAGVASVLTLGPILVGLANLATSLGRSLEALAMTALLMALMAWWTLLSPQPTGLDGFTLAATSVMKGRAASAVVWAWLVASGVLPFTLARDDLRTGTLGYGAAALVCVVPALLLTPPDPLSTVLVVGANLLTATLGLGLGALSNRIDGGGSTAPGDKT